MFRQVTMLGFALLTPTYAGYVKAKVRVHRYLDGALAIFHGPRKLACYTPEGRLLDALKQAA